MRIFSGANGKVAKIIGKNNRLCSKKSATHERVVLGWGKLLCHSQCAKLVGFQRNLLCQHDIACDETRVRHKTPTDTRPASVIDLMDIHRGAVVNPVWLASVAACDVEDCDAVHRAGDRAYAVERGCRNLVARNRGPRVRLWGFCADERRRGQRRCQLEAR
jgi:hypothetical protein